MFKSFKMVMLKDEINNIRSFILHLHFGTLYTLHHPIVNLTIT